MNEIQNEKKKPICGSHKQNRLTPPLPSCCGLHFIALVDFSRVQVAVGGPPRRSWRSFTQKPLNISRTTREEAEERQKKREKLISPLTVPQGREEQPNGGATFS